MMNEQGIELVSVSEVLGVNQETGIASDYSNAFNKLPNIKSFASIFESEEEALASIKEHPIKKYAEHIEWKERQLNEQSGKPKKFNDIITPKNELYVRKLDELVDKINGNIASANSINEILASCKPLFEEAGVHIHGTKGTGQYQFKL